MTREEVLVAYKVNDAGIITSPGKFEGEMLYVPALWEYCMDGGAAFDDGSVYGIGFEESDLEEFPEIGDSYGILLEESDNGFVNTREFDTKAEFDAAVAKLEETEVGENE